MARTAATIQNIKVSASTAPSFVVTPGTGVGNGITLAQYVGVIVEVKNTTAGVVTVTLVANTNKVDNWLTPSNQTYTCPATTGDILFAVNDPVMFQQPDGTIAIDFSASGAGITYAVYQITSVAL